MDNELLTMGRIKRLLEPLNHDARQRIATWVNSMVFSQDTAVKRPEADPRQLRIPAAESFPE
jgi:hypothetical protein